MTEQELMDRLETDGEPFVVFLHTPLCGTCKAAGRMLDVAGHLLPPMLTVADANVNLLPKLVERYRISSVPALLVVPGSRKTEPNIHYAMGSVERILDYIRRGILS